MIYHMTFLSSLSKPDSLNYTGLSSSITFFLRVVHFIFLWLVSPRTIMHLFHLNQFSLLGRTKSKLVGLLLTSWIQFFPSKFHEHNCQFIAFMSQHYVTVKFSAATKILYLNRLRNASVSSLIEGLYGLLSLFHSSCFL